MMDPELQMHSMFGYPQNVMSVNSNFLDMYPSQLQDEVGVIPFNMMDIQPGLQQQQMVGAVGADMDIPQQQHMMGAGAGMLNNSMPMRPMVQFNQMEIVYYRNIWRMVDSMNEGYVVGEVAANYLRKSGLPYQILLEIWHIVDPYDLGSLDAEGFFLACRLVAHAQSGSPVNAEMMHIAPISLPSFDVTNHPGTVENAVFDTKKAGEKPQNTSNVLSNGQGGWADMMASIPVTPMAQPDWIIPFSMQQKYRNLFFLMDSNADGYVEGVHARTFLSQSALPSSELKMIWDVADNDGDGRLTMEEFAIALHLVNGRLKNYPIPAVLPEVLKEILDKGLVVTGDIDISKGVKYKAASKGIKETKNQPTNHLSTSLALQNKKSETLAEKNIEQKSLGSKEALIPREDIQTVAKVSGIRMPTSFVEHSIETDRKFTKQLAQDVNDYADRLNDMKSYGEKLKEYLVNEKKFLAKELDRKYDFEILLKEERAKLDALNEERRKVELDRLAVSRDIEHYQEEITYLQRQIEDSRKDLQSLQATNLALEKNYKQSESQLVSLDNARKRISERSKDEGSLLAEDEKQISTLRDTLERVKREKANTQAHNVAIQERVRHADQDRLLLLSSIEMERGKLVNTKDARIEAVKEKHYLEEKLKQAQPFTNHQSVTRLRRDGKGVPVGSVMVTDEIDLPLIENSFNADYGVNAHSNWAIFGLPKKYPTIREMKFNSSMDSERSPKLSLSNDYVTSKKKKESKVEVDEVMPTKSGINREANSSLVADVVSLKGDNVQLYDEENDAIETNDRKKSDVLFSGDDFAEFSYDLNDSSWVDANF